MQRWPAQPVADAVRFFATSSGIGIGQDDDVILRAAEGEHPLAARAAAREDELRHRRAADERAGADERMIEHRLDGLAVALHDIENAIRQAGLGKQLGRAAAASAAPARSA